MKLDIKFNDDSTFSKSNASQMQLWNFCQQLKHSAANGNEAVDNQREKQGKKDK